MSLIKTYLLLSCFTIFTGCNSPASKPATTPAAVDAPTKPGIREFVFGKDPGFKQCHASTILRLKNGEFLVAWFGGTVEKNDDVGIWMSRRSAGQWTKPAEVAKLRNDAHWNPVLFQSASGKIFLFFKVGKEIERWETWVQTSEDDGHSWSAAFELVQGDHGGRGPVKNKPIILSNGDWLAGASHEANGYHVFVDRSNDSGRTWFASKYLPVDDTAIRGLIQPTLWESTPGEVHMLLRSSMGYICRSDSKDFGKTWSPVTKTILHNPNSGIDLTDLPGNILVLAYNPDGRDDGDRAPLLMALSSDNGHSWTKQLNIADGKGDDEFSYPAVISFGDSIAVSYTWQRKNIAFWEGARSDIANGTYGPAK